MSILDTICEHKRGEIERLRARGVPHERPDAPRGFLAALRDRAPIGLIAEIKKASPSRGLIRPDFDPPRLAQAYERAGAHCLSVLTDARFFQGDNAHLAAARNASSLPALRKDFILHSLQVKETFEIGADALLLIVAILDPHQLCDLHAEARALGLDVLVEVHDERELETALSAQPLLIGINNRNLHDFSVSLETTERVARQLPPGIALVSESGIFRRADIDRVKAAGASAVLVGEALMREPDVAQAVRQLLNPSA